MNKKEVFFQDQKIFLKLEQGEVASMPLALFPKLARGSKKDLENYELTPFGIHWPALDEDLSFEGFLHFKMREEQFEN
jgi:hypothetical protein